MGKFAENLNLGKRAPPPPPDDSIAEFILCQRTGDKSFKINKELKLFINVWYWYFKIFETYQYRTTTFTG